MMKSSKIKEAVHSIEMTRDMKSRMIDNLYKIENEKSPKVNHIKWISAAGTLAISLIFLIIMPIFEKNGNLHVSNFSITAYALSEDGHQIPTGLSSEKAIFEFSTEDRMGYLGGVGGDGYNLMFTNVMLSITGEDIESITYTINKGEFIEDVTFNGEQRLDKEWLLSEKIYIITREAQNLYQGIKFIGNTYTVKYNEQNQNQYTIAIPHDGNFIIDDDITINVLVKYTDGKAEQQDIIVTQEEEQIFSLKYKE